MNQTPGQNVPVNQQMGESFEVGNTEGRDNEMSVDMDSLPLTPPAKNVKIGNTKGDKNKTSIVIGSGNSKKLKPVWIVGGIILTAFNSIAANILSSYIQEKYGILTQNSRLMIVACVFVITLLFASWLAVKNSK